MAKRIWIFIGLLALNGWLAAGLLKALRPPIPAAPIETTETEAAEIATPRAAVAAMAAPPVPATPFAAVYSSRPHEFVANLRSVGCPEETVKDILLAEIGRRYHRQEADLRPTPGDHVPWGWGSKTSEAKIIERRQQAAAIAREKEGLLRNALGYEVKTPIPFYAMTVGDQRFQATLETLPPEQRQAAHLANEQYWLRVEQLRSRTRGFWEQADVEELNDLKRERERVIEGLRKELR
jgi:hypothetical protein